MATNVSERSHYEHDLESALEVRSERLGSWKQIAVYLRRVVRTVQRWEKSESLPVHRHFHAKGGTVYALKGEIDVWLKARGQIVNEFPECRKPLSMQ